jgi:excisionase family DNA binding protein
MSVHSTALTDNEKKGGNATPGIVHARGPPEPITVTVQEAIRLSGLSNTTIYKLIGEKKLEIIKVGARTLVTFQSLKALLQPASTA